MKLKKTAVVFAVLALVFALAGILLGMERTEAPAEESVKAITDISASRLEALLIADGDRQTVIYNDPSGLIIDGVSDMSLYSQPKLVSLAYSLIHLMPEKKLEGANASELVQEDNSTEICIFTDTDTVRLYLGRKCPVGEGRYLKNGTGEVFIISPETAELIERDTEDYRKLDMFPALSGSNLSSLKALRVTNGGEAYTLRQIEGDTVSTFFAMTEPVETVPDWENVYKKVLDPLFALTPDRFVSDNADMADYGFLKRDYVLELLIDGRVYACGFVQKEGGTYYCADMNSRLVSEISAEKLDFLSVGYMELIGSSVYSLSAADTASVSAKYSDGTVTLEVTGISDTLCSYTPARQLDTHETTQLFSQIVSVPASAQLTGDEKLSDEVLLTMSFEKRAGTTDILEFRPVNDRQCAVFINGRADFATYTTVVRDIISVWEKLA